MATLEEAARSRSRGRLDRRHERHARGDDPPALLLRRRRLARPRADADAGDPRPPRGGDPGLHARALLARRRRVRRRRRARVYGGRFHAGAKPRLARAAERGRRRSSRPCRGQVGEITKLEKTTAQGARAAALRPHLPAARGQHALRLLRPPHAGAAQRLYEEHKALTYPRTNSRFLPSRHDRARSSRPPSCVGGQPRVRARRPSTSPASTCCRSAAWSTTRRSPTTTRSSRRRSAHRVDKMGDDDQQVYDMVVRRFLAVFHPEAVFENTRVETDGRRSTSSARAARCCSCPGWRGVYGEEAEAPSGPRRRRRGRGRASSGCPKLEQGESVETREVELAGEGDQAAAALLRRLAARRDGDRRQARRRRGAARGDEGLRHRHAGHPRRDHRAADRRRLHRARRPRARRAPRRAST